MSGFGVAVGLYCSDCKRLHWYCLNFLKRWQFTKGPSAGSTLAALATRVYRNLSGLHWDDDYYSQLSFEAGTAIPPP